MPIVVRALYGTVPRSDLILPGSTSLWLPLVVTCPSCLGMWACKCQLGASLEKARVHHRRQLLNPPMPDRRQHHHRQSAVGRARNLHRQLARWLVARHSAGQTVGDQPQLVLCDNLIVLCRARICCCCRRRLVINGRPYSRMPTHGILGCRGSTTYLTCPALCDLALRNSEQLCSLYHGHLRPDVSAQAASSSGYTGRACISTGRMVNR